MHEDGRAITQEGDQNQHSGGVKVVEPCRINNIGGE
jgi:hypothetical protein